MVSFASSGCLGPGDLLLQAKQVTCYHENERMANLSFHSSSFKETISAACFFIYMFFEEAILMFVTKVRVNVRSPELSFNLYEAYRELDRKQHSNLVLF